MHQKEITQLQEDLKTKEDQLTLLKEKLGQTQQQLVKVEERLSSKYDYATVMDTLVTDENLKTSLEADKVDYHLQITNVRFSRREVKSKLDLKEIKMQKSKKVNRIAQNRVHMTSGGKSGSGQEEVFLPTPSTPSEEIKAVDHDISTAKPKTKTATIRQQLPAANKQKLSRHTSARVYSTRTPAAKPIDSLARRRAATAAATTAETSSRGASNRKPSQNMDGDFRSRAGATVNSERPKN